MITEFNLDASLISQTARNLEILIQQDPGGRGLAKWGINNTLFPTALSLAGGDHIILATGFYILSAGAIETDGPLGAIILADTLIKMGKAVTLITDSHAFKIMKKGIDEVNPDIELLCFDVGMNIDFKEIIRENTTHFIALERPGIAADGLHHNFRGLVISDYVASIDEVFMKASSLGIVTVGIGDGGNELGMGGVSKKVDSCISPSRDYSCKIKADYCVCAGVSNWAGYAIAGMLAKLESKHYLVDFEKFSSLFELIVKEGAVDGVSGKQEMTVDGLERVWEDTIYKLILELSKSQS